MACSKMQGDPLEKIQPDSPSPRPCATHEHKCPSDLFHGLDGSIVYSVPEGEPNFVFRHCEKPDLRGFVCQASIGCCEIPIVVYKAPPGTKAKLSTLKGVEKEAFTFLQSDTHWGVFVELSDEEKSSMKTIDPQEIEESPLKGDGDASPCKGQFFKMRVNVFDETGNIDHVDIGRAYDGAGDGTVSCAPTQPPIDTLVRNDGADESDDDDPVGDQAEELKSEWDELEECIARESQMYRMDGLDDTSDASTMCDGFLKKEGIPDVFKDSTVEMEKVDAIARRQKRFRHGLLMPGIAFLIYCLIGWIAEPIASITGINFFKLEVVRFCLSVLLASEIDLACDKKGSAQDLFDDGEAK